MKEQSWEDVLAAAGRLQTLLPDAVLVGGSAASAHAGHRVSFDDDHVLADLRERFDAVLSQLEAEESWITARINRPVLILGSLDGVETGIRQLIRLRPLEVEEIAGPAGAIRVPTLPEMLRIKAWLVLRRNATRDYLDVVALADRLGRDQAARVALELDAYYEDQVGSGGARVAAQLARQLAEPAPYDLSDVDLRSYRRLEPRWQDWNAVAAACGGLAAAMLTLRSEGTG
ncbi:MAG: hypothetical protein MSC30_19850 [Gaiellaceae bacterium MAG52_C11]|nr:hypothetical protein [Candidatus Gaiellasilicea maunaloa]